MSARRQIKRRFYLYTMLLAALASAVTIMAVRHPHVPLIAAAPLLWLLLWVQVNIVRTVIQRRELLDAATSEEEKERFWRVRHSDHFLALAALQNPYRLYRVYPSRPMSPPMPKKP